MRGKLNREFAFSSLVCVFPMAVGSALWGVLPDRAVRQLSSGGVSSWSKSFVVFAIPITFLLVHIYNCFFRKNKIEPRSRPPSDPDFDDEDDEDDEDEPASDTLSGARPDPKNFTVSYWPVPILCWITFIAFIILTFIWRVE